MDSNTGDAQGGEKVWLDYDQAELDLQYEQRSLVPDGDRYVAENEAASAQARADLDCRIDVPYGDGADEVLDIFPATAPGAPVLVFFHGGAWVRGKKTNESFIAAPLVAAGAAVVMVEFTLCPAGTLDNMVDQCRRAVAWVHANAGSFNGDAGRIVIAGHSSGSHLGGMLAVTDWADHGLPADVIKGAVLTSGIYELTPARLSHRNTYLFLDEEGVTRLSPMRHLRPDLPPFAILYGGGELPEFRRQSRAFAQALADAGVRVIEADIPDLNHFEMSRRLADTDGPAYKAAVEMLGLDG